MTILSKNSKKPRVKSIAIISLFALSAISFIFLLPVSASSSSTGQQVTASASINPSFPPLTTKDVSQNSSSIKCASHGYPPNEPACWPMGPADYGVNPQNNATYSYATQTFEAFITIDSLKIGRNNCGYICGGGQDAFTLQQNTVGNISADGIQQTYWTQDVPFVYYYPASQSFSVVPLDNIWNFSYPEVNVAGNMTAVSGNLNGQCISYGGAPTFYYCEATPINNLHLPLTIETSMSLYDVCTSTNVCTNYASFYMGIWHNTKVVYSNTFDRVEFTNGPALSAPSYYVEPCLPLLPFNASNFGKCSVGSTVTPLGLPYDAEWIIGGPADGSQVIMNAINAQMSEYYLNSATNSFASIPHAYSNGWDTAEGSGHVFVGSSGAPPTATVQIGTDDVEAGLW